MSRASYLLNFLAEEFSDKEKFYLEARKAMANNDKSRALEILQSLIDDPEADEQLRNFAQSDINHLHGYNVKRYNQLMATAPM